MKTFFGLFFSLFLLVSTLLVSCKSSSTDPGSDNSNDTTQSTDTSKNTKDPTIYSDTLSIGIPIHRQDYDSNKGGVQITLIAYNQAKNDTIKKINNEWIEIQSEGKVYTKGWTLNAGDSNQDYPLPDTLYGFLRMYTHHQADINPKYEVSLEISGNKWIWNNSDPDTAILFNAQHQIVSRLTY